MTRQRTQHKRNEGLSQWTRALLRGVAITLVGAGLIAMRILNYPVIQAQPQGSTASPPAFAVASVKAEEETKAGRNARVTPVGIEFTRFPLRILIAEAYDVTRSKISSPDPRVMEMLDAGTYDIVAKADHEVPRAELMRMLQTLLADRFKLVLHHSTKESSIYALLVAKGGSKLKQSVDDPNAPQSDSPPGQSFGKGGMIAGPTIGKDGMPQLPPGAPRGAAMMMMVPGGKMRMVANNATMSKFIDLLANQLDRPIVDMTGLTGTYDITLDFAPDPSIMQAKMAAMGGGPPPGPVPGGGGPEGASPDPGGAATIFSALPDQLGLRLEARKGPVDLIVIDSARKTPTEN